MHKSYYMPIPSIKPSSHQPDYFEREVKASNSPSGLGVPEFEALVLLAFISGGPGQRKSEVVATTLRLLGRPASDERIFLRYVDCLQGLGQVARYDFTYHLTPAGKARIKELRNAMGSALNLAYTVRF